MIGKGLDWLARHATGALAASIFIGLAVPSLAELLRPLLAPVISLSLAVALLKLDLGAVRVYVRRPVFILAITGYSMIAVPVIVAFAVRPLGLPEPLAAAIVLTAAAPTVISSVAYSMILGLDSALTITAMVVSYAIVPFTLPALALWLLGLELQLGAVALMGRLALIIGAACILALVLRRWVFSDSYLRRNATRVDAVAVITLIVFGISIMAGVTDFTLERPRYVALATGAAFSVNILMQVLGIAAFWRAGRREALTIGLTTGCTNMGLVLATLGDDASFDLLVFFALGQFPLFILPMFALPIYRHLIGRPD